jgi:hypothetical protein
MEYKFSVTVPNNAIYSASYYGPTFGAGFDINVKDNFNVVTGSYTYFGYSYALPAGLRPF